MKLFSKIRAKPKDSYQSPSYSYVFGRSPFAKRRLSSPLNLYTYTENGRAKAVEHPLFHILHDAPNSEMTSFVFRETRQFQIEEIARLYRVPLHMIGDLEHANIDGTKGGTRIWSLFHQKITKYR